MAYIRVHCDHHKAVWDRIHRRWCRPYGIEYDTHPVGGTCGVVWGKVGPWSGLDAALELQNKVRHATEVQAGKEASELSIRPQLGRLRVCGEG